MEVVSAVLTAPRPANMVGVVWEVSRSTIQMSNCTPNADIIGYSVREELPLPDKPPFTVHLGNLSFDATVGDVTDFFTGCECTNVRIIEDKMEMKPKGFGYAEFASLNGLKQALTLNGTQFQGRNIRISVADPRKFGSPTSRV
jgi:RNA recognition motif-containing protein